MFRRRFEVIPLLGSENNLLRNFWLYWTLKQARMQCDHLNTRAFFMGSSVRYMVLDRKFHCEAK